MNFWDTMMYTSKKKTVFTGLSTCTRQAEIQYQQDGLPQEKSMFTMWTNSWI